MDLTTDTVVILHQKDEEVAQTAEQESTYSTVKQEPAENITKEMHTIYLKEAKESNFLKEEGDTDLVNSVEEMPFASQTYGTETEYKPDEILPVLKYEMEQDPDDVDIEEQDIFFISERKGTSFQSLRDERDSDDPDPISEHYVVDPLPSSHSDGGSLLSGTFEKETGVLHLVASLQGPTEKKAVPSIDRLPSSIRGGKRKHSMKNFETVDEKQLKCFTCGKSFTLASDLDGKDESDKRDKQQKCEYCSSAVEQSDLKDQETSSTGKIPYKLVPIGMGRHKCDLCGERFTKICDLKAHTVIHTGQKPYTCNICEESFTRSGNLRTHKRIHTGEKPYKCNICEKKFRRLSHLRIHGRIHEIGEKPFKCNTCDAKFAHSENLKIHERIHTGEKPYKCDFCYAKFTQCSYLEMHKLIHTK